MTHAPQPEQHVYRIRWRSGNAAVRTFGEGGEFEAVFPDRREAKRAAIDWTIEMNAMLLDAGAITREDLISGAGYSFEVKEEKR